MIGVLIMKEIKMVLLTFFLLLNFWSTSIAKTWKGITPLKSTRENVENIFEKKSLVDDSIITYYLKNEKVIVTYSSGLCKEPNDSEWVVPKNTVITLTVYPKRQTFLSELTKDLSLFEKFNGPQDLSNSFYLINEIEGFSINVDRTLISGESIISSHSYFPTLNEKKLKCPITKMPTLLIHWKE
jgi:hypothetical protein